MTPTLREMIKNALIQRFPDMDSMMLMAIVESSAKAVFDWYSLEYTRGLHIAAEAKNASTS